MRSHIVCFELLLLFGLHASSFCQETCPTDSVGQLANQVVTSDFKESAKAAETLRGMGTQARSAIPVLIKAVESQDSLTRDKVAWAIGIIAANSETGAAEAVPALINALKDNESKYSQLVIFALGQIGPEAKAAVPHLIEVLNTDEADTVSATINTLAEIGPNAKAAVPTLMQMARIGSPETKSDVAIALIRIDPQIGALLIQALSDADPKTQSFIISSISTTTPQAESAIPALIELLRSGRPEVSAAAASALGRIGLPSVEPLIRAMKSGQADVFYYASHVFREIGPDAKDAVPVLIQALENPEASETVRGNAAYSLGQIGFHAILHTVRNCASSNDWKFSVSSVFSSALCLRWAV